MTTSYAKTAGFTEVAEKVSTSTKTGVKSCPDGAQEAFEDGSNQTGVKAEILVCQTKKAAAALLTSRQVGGLEVVIATEAARVLGHRDQRQRTGVHDLLATRRCVRVRWPRDADPGQQLVQHDDHAAACTSDHRGRAEGPLRRGGQSVQASGLTRGRTWRGARGACRRRDGSLNEAPSSYPFHRAS